MSIGLNIITKVYMTKVSVKSDDNKKPKGKKVKNSFQIKSKTSKSIRLFVGIFIVVPIATCQV